MNLLKTDVKMLLAFLLLFEFTPMQAQVNPKMPAWVTYNSGELGREVNSALVSNGYYYTLVDEQYNSVTHQRYVHHVLKVVSESGLTSASQIDITYDPSYQKAEIHFIRVHRTGETIDKTNSSVIKVLDEETQREKGILSGEKTIYTNLSDVRKGDLIEYAYTMTGKNKIFGDQFTYHVWFSYSVPVGKIMSRLLFDLKKQPYLLKRNFEQNPEITRERYLVYSWLHEDPEVKIMESGSPGWFDPNASVQVSSFSSWFQVKKWFSDLFYDGDFDRKPVKLLGDSIRKNYPDDIAKQITAAVDFVQNEIRYSGNENGIYTHTPHHPDFVLKHRYGDCKDKSLLLVELLKTLNVKAYPALVHTSLRSKVESQIYSFNKFDHCIVAIRYRDYYVFIDPTSQHQTGVFYKRKLENYGKAMVLDSSETPFSKIPEDDFSKTWVREEFEVDESTGDAKLRAVFRYSGKRADEVRAYFATRSLNVIQESYKGVYEKYAHEIIITDSVKINDERGKNEVTTEENYLLKGFWSSDGGKNNKIERDLIPYYLNGRIIYADNKMRRDPMELNHPVWVNHVIKVNKPGGWNIQNKDMTENNVFFYYKFNVKSSGSKLELNYQYTSRKEHVLPGEFALYKSYTDKVSENIVLPVEQQLVHEEAKGFNWLFFVVLITAATISTFICVQLNTSKDIVKYESRYESIGGWLALLGIGIVLTPITLTYQLFMNYADSVSVDYYAIYFSRASNLFDPLKGYFVLTVLALNVLLLTFSCFVGFLFFRRRVTFKLFYTIYKSYNLVLLCFDFGMTYLLFYEDLSTSDKAGALEARGSIMKIALQCCVWIPYLWISERSKHTFTENYKRVGEQTTIE